MLEPWIIEQIRRREEEERRKSERPQLEMPVSDERWRRPPDDASNDRGDGEGDRDGDGRRKEREPEGGPRGVVIIDM